MARSVKNLQTDFIKFHGCGAYRRDGTNVLCTGKNPCSNPINACFWMKARHVIHKVQTRNSELNDNILYSNSVKRRYYNELSRRRQTQYYSTDESSYSDSGSNSGSDYSDYSDHSDSDNNNLIIDIDQTVNDINHSIKSISETIGEITKSKQLIHETVTSHLVNETLNQVHEVTNTDQSQDLGLQSPNDKNKSIPLTI